jgi:hypothetical protein
MGQAVKPGLSRFGFEGWVTKPGALSSAMGQLNSYGSTCTAVPALRKSFTVILGGITCIP